MFRHLITFAVVTSLPLLSACERAAEPVAAVGVDPARIDLSYPGYAPLRLEWDMRAPLGTVEGELLVFVHLLDEPGSVVRTFDHPLPFNWQPGERQDYEITLYQSALAPPLENGEYDLSFGLYDRSGRRWALETGGKEVDDGEYAVARVGVDGRAEEVPMFYFSPTWLPLEAGTDAQILGRRWLTGVGSVRVAEIPGEGWVWMRVRIPRPEDDVEELSLAEGATEPIVVVGSSCGGEGRTIAGIGSHEIRLPVKSVSEGASPKECEILLEPNFQIVEVKSLARRSLALEILSWSGS